MIWIFFIWIILNAKFCKLLKWSHISFYMFTFLIFLLFINISNDCIKLLSNDFFPFVSVRFAIFKLLTWKEFSPQKAIFPQKGASSKWFIRLRKNRAENCILCTLSQLSILTLHLIFQISKCNPNAITRPWKRNAE